MSVTVIHADGFEDTGSRFTASYQRALLDMSVDIMVTGRRISNKSAKEVLSFVQVAVSGSIFHLTPASALDLIAALAEAVAYSIKEDTWSGTSGV